jgi:hypothetical protein
MLTISIAGGTRFSTVTNGMVALGVFGLGFLGGLVEQFGVMLVPARPALRSCVTSGRSSACCAAMRYGDWRRNYLMRRSCAIGG